MARVCSVCSHPSRERIDASIVRNRPIREIAKRFGLGTSAVFRHSQHLGRPDGIEAVVASKQSKQSKQIAKHPIPNPVNSSDSLLVQVRYLHDYTLHLLETTANQPKVQLQAIKEARANLEMMARLTGQWVSQHTVTGTVTHELADLDVDGLRSKLRELESDLRAIDTTGAEVQ